MTAADYMSLDFLADLYYFFGSWMIWFVKPRRSIGTLPDLLPPLASFVSLGCDDLVESLPFCGDVYYGLGTAFGVLLVDVFLERLVLTSGSTSGFLVSAFFFPFAWTALSSIQSEYCLYSLILETFLLVFCPALFYSFVCFCLSSAFDFLSSLFIKKSILY